ncbi:MAG: Hsp33 family molecular chaperone HslO [Lactobacillaceae bacterium]|nr:Hsp33 family molecular chaperone HslO [Lactobacillaceae bacterium]
MTNKNFDQCTSFHIDGGAFLGRFVRLDAALDNILGRHKYPKQVGAVVAECAALAVLLSSSMKYEGLFTLQTQSDGPVSMVVVDVTSDGDVRAYAKFDEERINRAKEIRKTTGEIEAAPHFLGNGHLAFTIDQGKGTDLYQGVVDIQGKTLSEVALRYFAQSEQIETYIKLYLEEPKNNDDAWKAAGLMLQKTPAFGGKTDKNLNLDDAWYEALVFAESLKDKEVFDAGLDSENILNRLYHANKLVISGVKNYKFACRCSRDKLLNTLSSFEKKDIDEMADKGKIAITCNFCSEQYIFNRGELIKH